MAVFAEALSVARLGAREQPAYQAMYGGEQKYSHFSLGILGQIHKHSSSQ